MNRIIIVQIHRVVAKMQIQAATTKNSKSMKQLFLMLILVSLINVSVAQTLPYKQMIFHLMASNELKKDADWQKYKDELQIQSICTSDTLGVYAFSLSWDHKYYFLLLKNGSWYKILNCDNIYVEWLEVDSMLQKLKEKISYDSYSKIVFLYIYNSQYHKTPPHVSFDRRGQVKYTYPQRKLVETKSFYFSRAPE